ncbi:MAG: bacteriohemerythrin [Desulfuromonas sp.]|nr:bacteriohemerythrin [Desulfuromonas sp.]
MAVILWKECYSVGISTFDDEHHVLVRVINDLYDAVREKKGDTALHNLLNILVEYTEKHFSHEEQYMDKIDYPDAAEHKEQHVVLKNKLNDYLQKVVSKETGLSPEVMGFLRAWLLDHIVETDKQFGDFLRSRSIYDCGPADIT